MNTIHFIKNIIKNQALFHPVVPFDHLKDKLISFDFTSSNEELSTIMLEDTKLFTAYINEKLKNQNARYGIGGYGEHRSIFYSMSHVFDASTPGEEPRRLHLGVDIWGRPHVPVMAPLAGIVHSFAFNDQFGDYGTTIILSHVLDGMSFYTLYGHLALSSIKNLQEGDRLAAGDIFGEFGIPAENGHWPPHLHFQIILDLGNWKGDYPGVSKLSEKEAYLSNSPDPDIILQLNQYLS